jgi:hypothetical protein
MAKEPEFDVRAAHRYFSAYCFNQAWDLIDKAGRTSDEDEQMLRLSLASHWHWTQREDYTPTGASIGYWQTSRIYALLGRPENARRYAQLSLQASQAEGVGPFFKAYAYEALARAEALAGQRQKMEAYLLAAQSAADEVPEAEDRQQILTDLETIHLK